MRQKFLLLGAVVFGLLAFVLSYQQLEAEKGGSSAIRRPWC